jgi:hypothetical protein
MLRDANDEQLSGVAAHLGVDAHVSQPGIEPSFWRLGHFRVFVGHLATHQQLAADLAFALLLRYQISAFVAHRDIEPTREWQNEIELALRTCDAFIALLTPEFHESNWTDQEIGFAMGRGVLIVSVRLGQDLYGFIGKFQALNGKSVSGEALAAELFSFSP